MFETSADPARPYNTLLVRGAADAAYRKIHLYDSFGYRESDALSPGDLTPVLVDVAGFRVGLMTCYDLRFPELARLLVDRGAEVLVVPSAWVAGPRKVEHWRTLVRARAIENTVFVVAAAQPGPRYSGHSMVVDPLGRRARRGGRGAPRCCGRPCDREVLTIGPAHQPLPGQPAVLGGSGQCPPLCNLSCRATDRPSTTRHAPRAGPRTGPSSRTPVAPAPADPEPWHEEVVAGGDPARGYAPERDRQRRRPRAGPEPAARGPVAAGRRRRPGRTGLRR